jgi:hypothetical protein
MTKVGGESLFVLEAVMLVAFGVAWFIKGTTLRFPARAANLGVDGEAEVDAAVARVGPA